METTYRCVITEKNRYKGIVLLTQGDGTIGYTLTDGERIIDALPPTIKYHAGGAGFVHPCWDEDASAWVEGASAEEIAAWEADHPAPEIVRKPTAAEQLRADVDFMAAMTGVEL